MAKTRDLKRLAKLLNQNDVRGSLLRDFAHMDAEMDIDLMFYFTTNKHHEAFQDLVLPRLAPNDKLRAIARR
ncbi:MAG TPA: hypothetical protein VFB63_26020 [Bryobacteraceae bacterium]|nr:hypothetical protein [Bryobacteraceae bacterium]